MLTVQTVTNLHWSAPSNAAIDCTVKFEEMNDAIPFTAVPFASEFYTIEIWDKAQAGEYGAIAPYVAPAAVIPETISKRQFFQVLAVQHLITDEEALAAVMTGTIPTTMAAFVDALPEADRFAARMLLCGATEFHRSHPLVAAFGTAQGMTSQQVDALWVAASTM